MKKVTALAGISAGTTVLVHEWLHSSTITEDLPEIGIVGNVGSTVGSVSVGLAVFVVIGIMLNYYLGYEMDME